MTTVEGYMSYGDQHGISVDDFIKTFSVNESPARPTLAHMGAPYAPNSSPYRPTTSNYQDMSNAAGDSEWFGVDYNSMSLTESTPSSRGSSLETPNSQHSSFMSIDPSRLSKGNGYVDTMGSRQQSPAWSIPQQSMSSSQQQQQQQQRTSQQIQQPQHPLQQQPSQPSLSLDTSNLQVHMSAPVSAASTVAGSPLDLTPTAAMPIAPTVTAGSKRKRQGSLPEICIPMSQQSLGPGPRTFQRSASAGVSETQNYLPQIQTQPMYLSQASPITGPSSAPPMSHHPQSFSGVVPQQPQPQMQQPQQLPQQPTASHSQANRSFSSLATIPESANSANAEYTMPQQQQMQQMDQQHQQQDQFQQQQMQLAPRQQSQPPPQQQQMLEYQQHPPPQFQQQPMQHYHGQDMPAYGVMTPTLPASTGHSPMMHQGQPLPMGRPAHLLHTRSASAGFPLPPNHHHMHQQQMHMAGYHQQRTQHVNAPTALGLNPAGLGMGRPIHTPAHMRRSSDSELAFGVGPNIGAMSRSTSVPQAPARGPPGVNVYGSSQGLPPPPPVTTYSAHDIAGPYAESFVNTTHNLYPEGPNMPSGMRSPPRKRVASKRVGTCLKPGPKSKNPKNKTEASPSGSSTSSLPAEPPSRPLLTTAPRVLEDYSHLTPVTVEEFKAAFDVTPSGTLIPKPGMEELMDRMMYATCETVVDQCFRHCYVVGSEYHKVAEKQSKYFKCSFDECVGSSTRIFMRKSAVDSHVRTHVGFRPFKCEIDPECDARFVRKHDRDRHVATTHKNEKSFTCSDCGQNFARSDALLRHRAKRDACKARTG